MPTPPLTADDLLKLLCPAVDHKPGTPRLLHIDAVTAGAVVTLGESAESGAPGVVLAMTTAPPIVTASDAAAEMERIADALHYAAMAIGVAARSARQRIATHDIIAAQVAVTGGQP